MSRLLASPKHLRSRAETVYNSYRYNHLKSLWLENWRKANLMFGSPGGDLRRASARNFQRERSQVCHRFRRHCQAGKGAPLALDTMDSWDYTVFLMFLILREKCQTMRGRNLYASSGENLVLEAAVEEAGGRVFRWRGNYRRAFIFCWKKLDFPHKYAYVRIYMHICLA